MFGFKGNLLTKWRRYCRWKKLHGYSPLTRENLLSLNPGDRIILIKRNTTTDVIALSCGISNAEQPSGEIAEWYVAEKKSHSLFIRNINNKDKSFLNPELTLFKGFNLIEVKPHFLSETFKLRAYYKRLQ